MPLLSEVSQSDDILFSCFVCIILRNLYLYQQGCIQLIKSESKDIHNVTKDFYYNFFFFWHFYSKKPAKKCQFYIKDSTTVI